MMMMMAWVMYVTAVYINIGPHMTELGEMGWSDLPRSVSPGQINFNMGERGPGGQVGEEIIYSIPQIDKAILS